jgi:hypothetical protein
MYHQYMGLYSEILFPVEKLNILKPSRFWIKWHTTLSKPFILHRNRQVYTKVNASIFFRRKIVIKKWKEIVHEFRLH